MYEIEEHVEEMMRSLRDLNHDHLLKFTDILWRAWLDGGTVFVCGNGGSASIADHFVSDLSKGTAIDGMPRLRALSLCSNISFATACANDGAYAGIFADQLRSLRREGDVLVAISTSGDSENVLKAARYIKKEGNKVVALTGFGGGKLATIADVAVTVDSRDYGVAEAVHSFLCHLFERMLRARAVQYKHGATPPPDKC